MTIEEFNQTYSVGDTIRFWNGTEYIEHTTRREAFQHKRGVPVVEVVYPEAARMFVELRYVQSPTVYVCDSNASGEVNWRIDE